MLALVIYLPDFDFSQRLAQQTAQALRSHGIEPQLFAGVDGDTALRLVQEESRMPDTANLHRQHGDMDHRQLLTGFPGVLGCFYSHLRCWQRCVELDQDILIFEDDVLISSDYVPVPHAGVLILSVHDKMQTILQDADFTFSASGYRIDPASAKRLLQRYHQTYDAADWCLMDPVAHTVLSSRPMGRKIEEHEGKPSLTMRYCWLRDLRCNDGFQYK